MDADAHRDIIESSQQETNSFSLINCPDVLSEEESNDGFLTRILLGEKRYFAVLAILWSLVLKISSFFWLCCTFVPPIDIKALLGLYNLLSCCSVPSQVVYLKQEKKLVVTSIIFYWKKGTC